MTAEELQTYNVLLQEIANATPQERPNRLYHLREFVDIISQKDKEENDLFS